MPLKIPGKITVTVAGTPVQVWAAIKAAFPTDKAYDFKSFHAVLFQARVANTGSVYIGGQGMAKATGVGVSAVLVAPSTNQPASYGIANQLSPAGVDLDALYVDADTAGDGVLVTLLVS